MIAVSFASSAQLKRRNCKLQTACDHLIHPWSYHRDRKVYSANRSQNPKEANTKNAALSEDIDCTPLHVAEPAALLLGRPTFNTAFIQSTRQQQKSPSRATNYRHIHSPCTSFRSHGTASPHQHPNQRCSVSDTICTNKSVPLSPSPQHRHPTSQPSSPITLSKPWGLTVHNYKK